MADDDLAMSEDAAMSEDSDTPILDVLATMTEAAVERSTLDPAAQILLRFAALVALDAAPASYLFHFGAGAEQGLTMEDARQVLVTLAPVVGTARIVSASSPGQSREAPRLSGMPVLTRKTVLRRFGIVARREASVSSVGMVGCDRWH